MSTEAPETITTFRSCNLCEAVCGLAIEHDGNQVISIRGDKDDPLSAGYLCPKGTALGDIHSDPNRLRQPMRKNADGGFGAISWEEAFDLVEREIVAIRGRYGDDAVALYLGNPTVHNSGALIFQKFLKQALGTRNSYSATSVDQLPHHFAASLMFGHGLLIPVPDIDHTGHMLILGANPAASNGSLMTAPGIRERLRKIQKRGGKVVLIDPRATETARLADTHHFIRPGSDAPLLAAILHVLFAEGLTKLDRYPYLKNADALEASVVRFTPDYAASHCGIGADAIRRMARDLATAESAVVYGRMGVSTQPYGGLCHWLINAINLATGNLDRRGGQMFTKPAVSLIGRNGTAHEIGRWHSRVRGLPEFEGSLPVSAMAEEMLTPGEGQVRALITYAGNPVLSTPNGRQMDKALAGLDFSSRSISTSTRRLVTRTSSCLLRPGWRTATRFRLQCDLRPQRGQILPSRPRALAPQAGALHDWEIMKELCLRLGKPGALKRAFLRWATPERLLDIGLSIGPYGILRRPIGGGLNLRRLKSAPHGIDLGPLEPRLPKILRTIDRKVDAAPAACLVALAKLAAEISENEDASVGDDQFLLIGRRHLRSNNSWMHNSERLMKGKDRCTLMMHEDDAARLGLGDGQVVRARSRTGEIELPLELTLAIMPGVISIPHGYGHNRKNTVMPVAEAHAGASINDLTDERIVDALTGNAAFSGQRVAICAADS